MLGHRLCLGLVLLAAMGCTRVERAHQCRQLAKTVNPRLAQVRSLAAGEQVPTTLRSVANHYDGIADDLSPLEFQSRALAQAVQEYGRHLRALGAEARKAASALEKEDVGAHRTARREVRLHTGQLRSAQQRIEDTCK